MENKLIVVTEMISPELIDWWLDLSIVDRESIIFNAYSERVLGGINGRN